jgi:hypothetical protein
MTFDPKRLITRDDKARFQENEPMTELEIENRRIAERNSMSSAGVVNS